MKFNEAVVRNPAWLDSYQLSVETQKKAHHIDEEGNPVFINSLILSQSPYLLQHAHNPVNWLAWGEQSLSLAEKENKPIFLSIGYATCHWCHVMEEESFENLELAKLLNSYFICIKVDREEHPAIDDYYMTAVQLMTGQGGWPMSSFLTPQGQPFFSGTYFKPAQFAQLLKRVHTVWKAEQPKLIDQASRIEQAIYSVMEVKSGTSLLGAENMSNTVDELASIFDATHGGFSGAPKFPQEVWLLFLLQAYHQKAEPKLAHILKHSLDVMQRSGLCDQIAGGFHRYTVDASWMMPHFEKMLYNQSQLAEVYLQAWQLFGEKKYAATVISIIDFVLNDFTAECGGFYSAFDADSENNQGQMVEGAYYVWSYEELSQLLNAQEMHWMAIVYGVSRAGNFDSDNILHQHHSDDDNCEKLQQSFEEYELYRSRIHNKLLQHRIKRKGSLVDKKIITAWNASMLRVMAIAGQCLNKPQYIGCAERCAQYLMNSHAVKLKAIKGIEHEHIELKRASLAGVVSPIAAGLSDYAAFGESLLILSQVTGKKDYFIFAEQLLQTAQHVFKDSKSGIMYDFAEDPSGAIARRFCKITDAAVASANARYISALVCYQRMYLSWGFIDNDRLTSAGELLALYAKEVIEKKMSCTGLMRTYLMLENGPIANDAYAFDGRVRLWVTTVDDGLWHLHMIIHKDWSINPSEEQALTLSTLVGEETDVCNIERVVVKQGSSEINSTLCAKISAPDKVVAPITLCVDLQICDENQCLQPEKIRFYLTPLAR